MTDAPLPFGAVRPGETTVETPESFDAELWFLGRIRTPWTEPRDCPKGGDRETGPECRIELDPRWAPLLEGVAEKQRLLVLYWMHRARRDLATQRRRREGPVRGTFALRSPMRPNPIAASEVALLRVEGATLVVRGLDCVDGTPVLDLKPA
ncbi:SAM-dependent methyltransferase [Albimonas sp. CAU 1670]|uniref:SAM-dependent methyltransferase n=1 Tax=Albimonas sp. CAU 1670 TaxID=3032599 RepID=UPI0023DA84A9|nr:SAM-dependent methyltransferase [Albimonas sp. CAU 1670]MDF2234393.1 SAM-dependent methyltransferase [Albimonas sp. CAU 1670]